MASLLLQLRQKAHDLTDESRNLVAAAEREGRPLTDGEKARDDEIFASLEGLRSDIEREERRQALAMSAPAVAVAAPGESFRPVGVRVSDVRDRAVERPFTSFGEQLQAIAGAALNPSELDPRLLRYQAAATGLGAAEGSTGGFLVERAYSDMLMARAREQGVIAPRCRHIPLARGTEIIELPYIDETSRVTGSRWGGVQVYRAAEAAAVTATQPKFRSLEIRIHEMRGLCYATDRLLRNAPAMEAYVGDAFASEFAWKLDNEILNGTGSGQCLGIMNAAALVSIAKEAGQAAATVVRENIDKMWARGFAKLRPNMVWLANQDIEPQLEQLSAAVGTGGLPIFLPPGGITDQPNSRLKGRPILPIEQAATLGTQGDLLLVDLSQYLVFDQGTMEQESSMHVRFINHEMTFRFVMYVSGQPMWRSALTPANGSNSLSAYVTLDTRA